MLYWTYYISLILIALAGLALNLLGLPGLWLMVIGHIAYGWLTGWTIVSWQSILAVGLLACLAELLEFLAGAAGSKSAGGSKRSVVGAVTGGIVGGIVFTPMIPIPIVGTVLGACIGAFAGAAILEASKQGAEPELRGEYFGRLGKVGWGAFKGRLYGTVLKTLVGVAMLVVMIWTAFR